VKNQNQCKELQAKLTTLEASRAAEKAGCFRARARARARGKGIACLQAEAANKIVALEADLKASEDQQRQEAEKLQALSLEVESFADREHQLSQEIDDLTAQKEEALILNSQYVAQIRTMKDSVELGPTDYDGMCLKDLMKQFDQLPDNRKWGDLSDAQLENLKLVTSTPRVTPQIFMGICASGFEPALFTKGCEQWVNITEMCKAYESYEPFLGPETSLVVFRQQPMSSISFIMVWDRNTQSRVTWI